MLGCAAAFPGSIPAAEGSLAAPAAAEQEQVLAQRVSRGFDCCILAAPGARPEALLDKALPLLAPSASFVVFSNWSQPLAEAMTQLQVRAVAHGAHAAALQMSCMCMSNDDAHDTCSQHDCTAAMCWWQASCVQSLPAETRLGDWLASSMDVG